LGREKKQERQGKKSYILEKPGSQGGRKSLRGAGGPAENSFALRKGAWAKFTQKGAGNQCDYQVKRETL